MGERPAVLIVDDDAATCAALGERLAEDGLTSEFVHDGVTGVARLQEFAVHVVGILQRFRQPLGVSQDILAVPGLVRHFRIQRHRPRHLNHVDRVDRPLVPPAQGASQGQGVEADGRAVYRHEDVFDQERIVVQVVSSL